MLPFTNVHEQKVPYKLERRELSQVQVDILLTILLQNPQVRNSDS